MRRPCRAISILVTGSNFHGHRSRVPRILLVAPRFEPFASGVETHLAEVAPRLAARGLDVTILVTDPSGALPTRERIAGVDVRRVRAWPAGRDLHFAPGLLRVLAIENAWDLVHIHSYHTLVAPMAMLGAVILRLPFVITLHSGGHSSRVRVAARGAQLRILEPLLRRAKRIIAVSQWELDQFAAALRLPPKRFVLIPSGAELPMPDRRASPSAPLIASIGRLERYKGHHHVIKAMPRIVDALPEARLRIIGSGPYERQLRRLAMDAGVAGRVVIGPIPTGRRQALAALLSEVSVVAMLSDYESQGLAAYEAAAAGRPLVVAYRTALAELVDKGLAIGVTDVDDPESVASAIISQALDPLDPGDVTLPTWEGSAESIHQVYEDVLSD